MSNREFTLPVRVYYEDTDAGGVVYHSNYLNFMERARTEYLRELGYDQDVLANELDILFVVSSIQIDYQRPARFNDELEVRTSVENIGRASVEFSQVISRKADNPQQTLEVLTKASVKVACVGATTFKPGAIPQSIKGALSGDY
uniref:4-hydroxybenzoyl-CoA thioesterase family active site n=1 Tax=uncultured Thiotrichaceae bacterium TaxID=298394 RepID=A0A6S6U8G5_9GAMM|nr:MAG: 4-hydroxybenzoyl-CoA thioesterase family active site [uncultured Thiotrichaceae bacterium]